MVKGVIHIITFWNRCEVYMGFDAQRFDWILDVLTRENIKYKYRLVNHIPRSRGTAGLNLDYSMMYYVYVHKKDAEVSKSILRNSDLCK